MSDLVTYCGCDCRSCRNGHPPEEDCTHKPISGWYSPEMNPEMNEIFLPEWVKPGASFRDETCPDKKYQIRYHVRAVVDDNIAVLRFWSKQAQRWIYSTQDQYFFFFRVDTLKDIT